MDVTNRLKLDKKARGTLTHLYRCGKLWESFKQKGFILTNLVSVTTNLESFQINPIEISALSTYGKLVHDMEYQKELQKAYTCLTSACISNWIELKEPKGCSKSARKRRRKMNPSFSNKDIILSTELSPNLIFAPQSNPIPTPESLPEFPDQTAPFNSTLECLSEYLDQPRMQLQSRFNPFPTLESLPEFPSQIYCQIYCSSDYPHSQPSEAFNPSTTLECLPECPDPLQIQPQSQFNPSTTLEFT